MIVRKDFKSFMRGFVHAAQGLLESIRSQFNIRFHFTATLVAIGLSFYFHLSQTEWCLIIIAIAMVLVAELLNTAIEYLTDFVSPEYNDLAGKVKDIAAGAVLIAALASLTIGIIVFYPHIFS